MIKTEKAGLFTHGRCVCKKSQTKQSLMGQFSQELASNSQLLSCASEKCQGTGGAEEVGIDKQEALRNDAAQ